ncbi:MAG: hypothetical protein ACR2J8_13715, partial [Thermomicrobiales bacterium]
PDRTAADGGAEPDADLDRIVGIVRLLDGLPLAIELAAAQAATLPLATIAALLETAGLSALARGQRDAPTRFATMDAAIAWSTDLLPENARRLLQLLGVFRGGFTTEAVIGIAEAYGDPTLVAGLPRLAESNLIQPDPRNPGGRLRMLEPVRMFACDRLAAAGEERAARLAHADWFLGWACQQARAVAGPEPVPALDALDADLANLQAAFAQAAPANALVAASALSQYWEIRARFREGRAILAEALAASPVTAGDPTPAILDALYWSGYLAYQQSDLLALEAALVRLHEIMGPDDLPELVARTLILDVLRRDAAGGSPAEAIPIMREAHAMMAGQREGIAWYQSLVILANLHVQNGQYEEALPLLREYEEWARERQSALHRDAVDHWLGFALLRLGRTAEARELFAGVLQRGRIGAVGVMYLPLMGVVLAEVGLDGKCGNPDRAAVLLGAFDDLVAHYRHPIAESEAAALAAARARLAATLGEDRLAALAEEGAMLPLEEVVALAIR